MIEFTEEDRGSLASEIAHFRELAEGERRECERARDFSQDELRFHARATTYEYVVERLRKLAERPSASSPVAAIQRYEYLERIGVVQEGPEGEWVKYEDHLRTLAERPAGDAEGLREWLEARLTGDEAIRAGANRLFNREEPTTAQLWDVLKTMRAVFRAAFPGGSDQEMRSGEEWCGECGLRLGTDTPPGVWTGHVHRPLSGEALDAAWTLVAVVAALPDSPEKVDAEAGLDRHLQAAGITRSGAEMYGRHFAGKGEAFEDAAKRVLAALADSTEGGDRG